MRDGFCRCVTVECWHTLEAAKYILDVAQDECSYPDKDHNDVNEREGEDKKEDEAVSGN
jgi:hypothetical protein